MKKLVKLFICLFILFSSSNAQITEVVWVSASLNYFYEKVVSGPNTTYNTTSTAIGKEIVNNVEHTYRACFEINLSQIPSNATIKSVVVSIYNEKSGYTLKLTQVTTISQSDYQANWTSIGNSGALHTGIQYNSYMFTSNPLKSAIQNCLSTGNILIGACSESELTGGSNSSMSITLQVQYSRPPQQFSVTAENDMDGYAGGHIE